MKTQINRKRYAVLDAIRGIALLNMIIYHGIWDLVYMFGFDWKWYQGKAASLWQQAICCTFILLSGFCQPLGTNSLKRGITVSIAGALVSAVTIIFMPENRVLFGILTLLGSCMLLVTAFHPLLKKFHSLLGFFISILLFMALRFITQYYLNYRTSELTQLPGKCIFYLAAYLGFPMQGFYSTDYFPLLPWIFLFTAGYFLYYICDKHGLLKYLKTSPLNSVQWIGRHSLIIYLLHQPVLYAGLLYSRQLSPLA